MADLKEMVGVTKELSKFCRTIGSKGAPIWKSFSIVYANDIRDRLLKGIHQGYDINGKQFKHLTKFSQMIRKRELEPKEARAQEQDIYKRETAPRRSLADEDLLTANLYEENIEDFAEMMGKKEEPKEVKRAKRTEKIGGYTFTRTKTRPILFKTGDLARAIGDKVEGVAKGRNTSKVVIPKNLNVYVQEESLKEYMVLQNKGFNIPNSKFSRKPEAGQIGPRKGYKRESEFVKHKKTGWNTVGKPVPSRQWLGIPVSYRHGHPKWREHIDRLGNQINKGYVDVLNGMAFKKGMIDKYIPPPKKGGK